MHVCICCIVVWLYNVVMVFMALSQPNCFSYKLYIFYHLNIDHTRYRTTWKETSVMFWSHWHPTERNEAPTNNDSQLMCRTNNRYYSIHASPVIHE